MANAKEEVFKRCTLGTGAANMRLLKSTYNPKCSNLVAGVRLDLARLIVRPNDFKISKTSNTRRFAKAFLANNSGKSSK